MKEYEHLIKKLNLESHPEGGYYRQIYKSPDTATAPSRFSEKTVNFSTAIYYLLRSGDFSAWHKIQSDEIWHHYCGETLTIHILNPQDNSLKSEVLGNPLFCKEASPVVIVPFGSWFCAEVNEQNSFVLSGCTVSPGFEFADFEMAGKETLITQFPQHVDLIEKFLVKSEADTNEG